MFLIPGQVKVGKSARYLVRFMSGWALLPLLRSQRKEAESRGGRAEEVEPRLSCGVGRLFRLFSP